MDAKSIIVAAIFVPWLGGCGGGGEATSRDSGTSFTSFDAIRPGQSVQATGVAQTENVTQDSNGKVTADVVNAPDTNGVSIVLGYAPGTPLTINGIQFNDPRSTAGWQVGRGSDSVVCAGQSCSASSADAAGILIQPGAGLPWNFQTFGYWLATTVLPANVAGSISAGSPTVVGAVPAMGSTLSFSGISGGLYIDPTGALQEHAATATVVFNPVSLTINFTTGASTIRPWRSTGTPAAAPLDISGQLSFTAGTNRFSGNIFVGPSTAQTMTGTVTGVFYGPSANEIGGTFSLTSTAGSSVESMTGAFGARR